MIGEVIRGLRKEKNITQQDLAKSVGVTTSSIGMYETGVRQPSYDVLIKIANYFGVSVDFLLGIRKSEIINIADLYKDLLKEKISFEALANSIGLSIDVLNKIFRSEEGPTIDDYMKLGKWYGYSEQESKELYLKNCWSSNPSTSFTLAASRTDGYEHDLPEEAKEELKNFISYLKVKYKKKDSDNK